MDLLDQIPGYREALEVEREQRETAFIDAPELVCGVAVLPLTPRHVLILDGIGCPIFRGLPMTPVDIARMMWVISTDFTEHVTIRSRWDRYRMTRRVAEIGYGELLQALGKYVDDAFADSPAGNGGEKAFSSWVASYVHVLAARYGWEDGKILNTPLKRVFQLLRHIQRDNNPDAIFICRSDKVRSAWLRSLNEQRN